MAKKKSKWIKANAETARELDASRERRDREERTGGSLRAKTDGLLFAIDRTKGGAREAKVRDGLLTSVRRTMVGTNTKPAKLAHPRKGQTVYADAKHKRAIAIAPQPARHTPQTFAYDAWGADDAALVDIYTSTGQLVNPRAPPRPEPSLARAVEVVAAGASYNPTYDAHQLLLQSALDSELERQAAKMRYAHAHAPRAVDELNQVGDGETAGADDDDDDDDEEEGAAGEGEDAAVVARRDARVAERKSKTERNRLARKRAHEVKETERLRSKELDKQLNRAAHIAKEIEAEVQAKAAAEAAKPMRPEQLLGVPKKLGKFKQRSEPWAALLTEELPSNLRTLPPTNNLLSDRFRSVHKRNLMEPRMKQTKKRKYALKEYTKKGFKEEDWQKL